MEYLTWSIIFKVLFVITSMLTIYTQYRDGDQSKHVGGLFLITAAILTLATIHTATVSIMSFSLPPH